MVVRPRCEGSTLLPEIFTRESLMFFSKNPNQTSFFRLIFRFLLERDSLLKISGNSVAFTRLIKTIHN